MARVRQARPCSASLFPPPAFRRQLRLWAARMLLNCEGKTMDAVSPLLLPRTPVPLTPHHASAVRPRENIQHNWNGHLPLAKWRIIHDR